MNDIKRISSLMIATVFMFTLDITVVVSTFPSLAKVFQVNPLDFIFIISTYLLGMGLFLNVGYWASLKFGGKEMYLLGLALFILGSMICGLSEMFSILLLGRFIQATGAACTIAAGVHIMMQIVKPKHYAQTASKAMFFAAIGPVFGLLIGGYIIMMSSWPMVFFINIPIAMALFILIDLMLDENLPKKNIHFAWTSFLMFALTILSIAALIDSFVHIGIYSVYSMIVTLIVMCSFIYHHGKKPLPLLNVSALKTPLFRRYFIISNCVRLIVTGLFVANILFLQLGLQLAPLQTGLLLSVFGLGSIIARAILVYYRVRFNQHWHIVVCGLILALSILSMSYMTVSPSIYVIAIIFLIQGLLVTFFFKHVNQIVFACVHNNQMFVTVKSFTVFQFISWGLATIIISVLFQCLKEETATVFLMPLASFDQMYGMLSGVLCILCLFFRDLDFEDSKRVKPVKKL